MSRIISSSLLPRQIIYCYTTNSASLQSVTSLPNPNSIISPLYSFLPESQNPNNLVTLICSTLKQHTSLSTLHLSSSLNHLIPHMGTHHISRVLLRCQCESISALNFFNWVKYDLGISPNPHNYCIIIHILVWSKYFQQGMKLLCELISLELDNGETIDTFDGLVSCSEECNWDPVVFDMLIKAYVKDGRIKKGYSVFRRMVKMGYVPHVLAFNCLLNGLSKSNYIEKCWELYKEMWRIGIRPNTCTFNMLTHVVCKDRSVDKVNEFLEKMEEEGFVPDLVTYNTLIGSYCRNGRLDDAFYLYKIMYRRSVVPDVVTYTSLMSGLCKIGKVKEAHEVFHRMINRGLIPDLVSYNSLIHGYCREGIMKQSRLLVHEMIGNEILPDNFTCEVLMEGYGRTRHWHSALNMVVELKRFGVTISSDIYKYLIVSLSQVNRPFVAVKLLDRMLEDGYEPDRETYDKLIKSFGDNECIDQALQCKGNMLERSIVPSFATYQNLICCLSRSNRCFEAENLIQEMLIAGFKPDCDICKALVFGYCKERNFAKAESLLVSFAVEYQLYDTDSYNAVIVARSEHSSAIELMELQDKMLKLGFAPNNMTYKFIFNGLHNATRKNMEKLQGA